MSVSRKVVAVVVRQAGSADFVTVEVSTLGTGNSVQKQCCAGELEFDPATNKFVNVARTKEEKDALVATGEIPAGTKTARRPFSLDEAQPLATKRINIRERTKRSVPQGSRQPTAF